METIVFGGGCFWCTEAVFSMLKGVISVEPGYTGGETLNPTYEQICTGKTGHAEVIKIVYDPAVIAVRDLMTVFFATHDPSQLNRQGSDVGTQYRSAVFYTTEEQKMEAERMIKEIDAEPGGDESPHPNPLLNKERGNTNKVVTEVTPLGVFYPAENYHKDYFAKNPEQGYCQIVINPKVEKVQKQFAELLKRNTE
jgi:peptide-methionine (S)-S-oxide reductase